MLITILVGSSGSGKSTHAKTLNQVICSTNKYVEEQANTLGISYDNSFNVIRNIVETDKRVKVIQLLKNFGRISVN